MSKRQFVVTGVRENGLFHHGIVFDPVSKAKQEFKDDCDINTIMRRYDSTGEFGVQTRQGGQYADFSQITDYQEMVHTVRYADDAFMSLPASVRKRFENDPGQLLQFLQDDKNYDEGVSLGLVNPKVVAAPAAPPPAAKVKTSKVVPKDSTPPSTEE